MKPSPPSVSMKQVVFTFGHARFNPLSMARAASSEVSVPLNLSGAIKTRCGRLSEMEVPLRSFGMEFIEACLTNDASASCRHIGRYLNTALHTAARLSLGEHLLPCAMATVHVLIFHATNRLRCVS